MDSIYAQKDFRTSVFETAKSGVISIVGRFDEDMAEVVMQAILIAKNNLLSQRKEWVTFLIDSNGGSIATLDTIHAAMYQSGLKFKGVVQSKARSCGFLLLQYCNWRVALSTSSILFHFGYRPLYNSELTAIVEDTEWVLNHYKMQLNLWIDQVSERTGLSREAIIDLGKYERDILAQKALEMGLLDEVINSVPKSVKPPA